MLNNEAQAATSKLMLNPVSAANTAAATSGWIAVPDSVGDVMIVAQVGSLTGTLAWTLETASDGSGTGAAALTPNEGAFATVAANQVQRRTVRGNSTKGYIRIVGTIVTGPAVVAASLHYRPSIV